MSLMKAESEAMNCVSMIFIGVSPGWRFVYGNLPISLTGFCFVHGWPLA